MAINWRDGAAVREAFEQKMTEPGEIVTGNVARHLVPRLQRIANRYASDGAERPWAMAANHCSEIFLDAKEDVLAEIDRDLGQGTAPPLTTEDLAEAAELALAAPPPAAPTPVSTGLRDKRSQMLVSRGGKMFERFVPYALSKSLGGTPWAVWKDTNDISNILGISKDELLGFNKWAFGQTFRVSLEADFIALRPDAPQDHPIILMNCKTSAKERLHQATMWAILLQIVREPELSKKFDIEVANVERWKKCRYVGVIGDFAVEQPDLRGEPRRLLQFDFSFFDYTFAVVTEAWCPGFPSRYDPSNAKSIYRLSAACDVLLSLDQAPGS